MTVYNKTRLTGQLFLYTPLEKNPALFHIIIHPSTRFFADFIYTLSSQAKITKIKNPAYWSLPHVFLAE
jgi:hypothetical protein